MSEKGAKNFLTKSEKEFVEKVYKENYSMLVNFCLRKTGNVDDATELAQEVFSLFIQKLREISPEKSRAWLYGTAHNKLLEYYRGNERKELSIDEIEIDICESPSAEDEYFDSLLDVEEIKIKVLERLDEVKKTYYNDYFVLNLSHTEASKKYNISIIASKVRKSRLKQEIINIIKVIKEQ